MFQSLLRIFVVTGLLSTISCAHITAHENELPPVLSAMENITLVKPETNTTSSDFPKTIALLVPLQGNLAAAGQAIRDGFLAAYNDAPADARPTKVNVVDASENIQVAYDEAVQQGADFIVGPLAKPQVQDLAQMSNLSVPTLSLNYLDPGQSAPSNLYQFGLSPFDEARQAAAAAWQDNHRSTLIIVPAGSWGQSVAQAFQEQWQAMGGKVVDTLYFTNTNQALTAQIKQFLHFKQADKKSVGQRRQDFDVIFLAADAMTARQVRPLLKFYYAGNEPVYATSLIYDGGLQHANLDNDLNGVIFCDTPWTFDADVMGHLKQQLEQANEVNFQRNARLYALGIDAYQIIMHLKRLKDSSLQTLSGTTGVLYLNNQQRIVRQLLCGEFQGGKPIVKDENV